MNNNKNFVKIPVLINGIAKARLSVTVPVDASVRTVAAIVESVYGLSAHKVIVVPNRLVNVVS